MKWIVRGLITAALALLLVLAAAWGLLHSERASRPILQWALERAQAASKGRLEIEGARGALAREFFIDRLAYRGEGWRIEARAIHAQGAFLGALRGELAFDALDVGSVRVVLEEGEAEPKRAPSPPRSLRLPLGVRIAQARIGRLALERGADRQEARAIAFGLDAGARAISLSGLRASFPWGAIALDGEVEAAPPYALRAAGAANHPDARYPAGAGVSLGGTLERIEAQVTGGAAGVEAQARAVLAPFSGEPLRSLWLRTEPADLSRIDPAWPRTALSVEITGASDARALFAGSVVATNANPGPLDRERIPLARLQARFSTDGKTARLSGIQAQMTPVGSLTGEAELAPGRARVALAAQALDLRSLRSTLRHTALHGPFEIIVEPKGQSLRGELAQKDLRVAAEAVRSGDEIVIHSLEARAQGGLAKAQGRVRIGPAATFEGTLELARLDPSKFGDYPEASVNGQARVSGRLGAHRRIDAQWSLAGSRFRGAPLESRGSARLVGERVEAIDAQARLGDNRASARGAFGAARDRLEWTLEAPALDQIDEKLAGRVSARGALTGSRNDARITLVAKGESLRLPGKLAARSLSVNGSFGVDRAAPLEVEAIALGVSTPCVPLERLALRTSGTLARHEAEVSARGKDLDLDARLRGGWSERTGWSGTIASLANRGAYPLTLAAPAPLAVSSRRVELGRLEAEFAGGRVLVQRVLWAEGRLATRGEFTRLPLAWLLAPTSLAQRIESTLQLDGQWSLESSPRLTGTLAVRRSAGDLRVLGGAGMALGIEEAIVQARFEDGDARFDLKVQSRAGSAAIQGSLGAVRDTEGIGITARSPVSFRGRIELAALRALTQPFLTLARVDGRVAADLSGAGTLGEPRIEGTVRGDALSLEVPPYGVYLKDGTLRATLEGDALRLKSFRIAGGDGSFDAEGALPLNLSGGGAALAWRARRFRVLDRPDMRLVVSGSGAAAIEKGRLALSGALRADSGLLDVEQDSLPDLGGDVVVVGERRPADGKKPRLPVALDMSFDLGDDLKARGYGFDGRLAGEVRATTNAEGELRASGKIRAEQATFLAYGQKLEVDPGALIFDGPIDNPALQVTAWRRNQAVSAGVQVSGPLRTPRVALVSNPPVTEGEALSWLVLGHAPTEANKGDLSLLQTAAAALFARGRSVPVTTRLANLLGLDEIALRGSSELSERVVAFGKRLSRRFYITYEQGLGPVASNLVKLDFSLTQHLSVRAGTGTSTGLGLIYRYSWE